MNAPPYPLSRETKAANLTSCSSWCGSSGQLGQHEVNPPGAAYAEADATTFRWASQPQTGDSGAAGLDVFEDEPHVPEALRALPNVVLTPHVASLTVETRQAMGQLVVDNLLAHFAGKPPPTPVA